jgi:hypothetical protein
MDIRINTVKKDFHEKYTRKDVTLDPMTIAKYVEDLESWEGERKSERETNRRRKEAVMKGKRDGKPKRLFLSVHRDLKPTRSVLSKSLAATFQVLMDAGGFVARVTRFRQKVFSLLFP